MTEYLTIVRQLQEVLRAVVEASVDCDFSRIRSIS
ncbi:hypothetical protein ES708_25961 [subsurface metagenome]